ncbi:MAG: hypothetical protein OXF20_09400 [Gammaproteobacteria bacterium]|nr:hypothetical protein [Gammaproteobacteria bacterium]
MGSDHDFLHAHFVVIVLLKKPDRIEPILQSSLEYGECLHAAIAGPRIRLSFLFEQLTGKMNGMGQDQVRSVESLRVSSDAVHPAEAIEWSRDSGKLGVFFIERSLESENMWSKQESDLANALDINRSIHMKNSASSDRHKMAAQLQMWAVLCAIISLLWHKHANHGLSCNRPTSSMPIEGAFEQLPKGLPASRNYPSGKNR